MGLVVHKIGETSVCFNLFFLGLFEVIQTSLSFNCLEEIQTEIGELFITKVETGILFHWFESVVILVKQFEGE